MRDKYVAEIHPREGSPSLAYTYAYSHSQAWRFFNSRYRYPYYTIAWVQNMRTGERMMGDTDYSSSD